MNKDIDSLEADLFIQAIKSKYGYDFSEYSQSSFYRRLRVILSKHKFNHLGECQHSIIHDKNIFLAILNDLTITVTELFRDPYVYGVFRKIIAPYLRTFPEFKVWHAGCATGEEAYSFAILLKEEALLDQAVIYATDINKHALNIARNGNIKPNVFESCNKNYLLSGGHDSLEKYFFQEDKKFTLDQNILNKILFAEHNLCTDYHFGEVQFISCRNVLIYFTKPLQKKVLQLFTNSLCPGGYLCLGSKENIYGTGFESTYDLVDYKSRLFRKKINV